MAKEKTVYVCTNCGQESPKWQASVRRADSGIRL